MSQTLLQRGATFLRTKLPQVGSEYVEYRRGTEAIERLEVVQGNSEVGSFQVEDGEGTYKSIDWYVALNELVLRGSGLHRKVEPEKGDEIRRTNEAGETEIYQILPVPGGRCFEIVDERLGLYGRIHSKFVGIE